jgi:DNA-binding transcriptional ArsR family regulator
MKEIIEFLRENGESTLFDMSFPGVDRRTLSSRLMRLYETRVIDRRMSITERGDFWAYSAVDGPDRPYQYRNEPDPVYYLRNLPRDEFLELALEEL